MRNMPCSPYNLRRSARNKNCADFFMLRTVVTSGCEDLIIMIEEMQKRIDQTCWKLSFLSCWKVLYETDANWRRIINVRDMKKSQLGYYGQDITVSESVTEKFYKIDLDLSIMEMHIECQDILVEKVLKEKVNFFWTYNQN